MRAIARLVIGLWLGLTPAFALTPAEVARYSAPLSPPYATVYVPVWTGFTVTALGSALKADWYADDHGTANMTDDGAGAISAWADRINAISATGATTARPTWGTTAFNGSLAGLTCNGSANVLTSTSIAALPTGATAGSIYVEASQDQAAGAGGTRVVIGYGNDTSRRVSKIGNSSVGAVLSDEATNLTDLAINYVGPHIVSGTWSGTTQSGRIDGRPFSPPSATIASLNTPLTRIRICARQGSAGADLFWLGVVRRILITTLLTSLQELQIEALLAYDGRINQVLVYNHPFRYRKP